MTAKQIDWGLDNNKGVSFYTISKGLDKVLLQEGALMITLGKAMNELNNATSNAANNLQKITKNLNKLNFIDTNSSTYGYILLIASIGMPALMGLSSIAMEAEASEDASLITKGASKMNKLAQASGSAQAQYWLKAAETIMGSGMIISTLRAIFSVLSGVDNEKITKLNAYSDACQQDSKLETTSEDKASKTMQAIGKAIQKAIQAEYRSKTKELYYNN